MRNENHIEKMLREMYGDPIDPKFGTKIGDQQAGDSSGGVRDMRTEIYCVGCGLPSEECMCADNSTCPACGMMPIGGECSCGGLNEVASEPCSECGMLEVDGKCECSGMNEGDGEPCSECGMMEVGGVCGCTHMSETKIHEVAPEGYEKIIKALKRNPSVENPWAVAWSMKKKGIKPKKKSKGGRK